jgi:hypothetical protein
MSTGDTWVTVDADPPSAGETLDFDIEMAEIFAAA